MLNCAIFLQQSTMLKETRMVEEVRRKIASEEFDYHALLDGLKEYIRPRDKITDLLRRGLVDGVLSGCRQKDCAGLKHVRVSGNMVHFQVEGV